MLTPEAKDRVLRSTAESLTPAGRFLTYQFVPPLASFDSFLRRPMERYFEVLRIEYELLNLPPLRIYESRSRIAEANCALGYSAPRVANE